MVQRERNLDFELHLTPHRSLPPRGFLILMAAISAFSFIVGLYFWSLGAWPVAGFFGLDLLLVYVAFRWTYHTGKAREIIGIKEDRLEIERISPAGKSETTSLQAFWTRAFVNEDCLCLSSHGRTVQIGTFLAPEEKQAVCRLLSDRLREFRTIG